MKATCGCFPPPEFPHKHGTPPIHKRSLAEQMAIFTMLDIVTLQGARELVAVNVSRYFAMRESTWHNYLAKFDTLLEYQLSEYYLEVNR